MIADCSALGSASSSIASAPGLLLRLGRRPRGAQPLRRAGARGRVVAVALVVDGVVVGAAEHDQPVQQRPAQLRVDGQARRRSSCRRAAPRAARRCSSSTALSASDRAAGELDVAAGLGATAVSSCAVASRRRRSCARAGSPYGSAADAGQLQQRLHVCTPTSWSTPAMTRSR